MAPSQYRNDREVLICLVSIVVAHLHASATYALVAASLKLMKRSVCEREIGLF
jgi:hypothetical protein